MFKVTVIVPTYKPKHYIYECLDSLVKQTLDSSLYEIIIMLNGSKDPFFKNIQSYIEKFPEVSIKLAYVEQSGVSNARNKGLEIASGEYIAFVDDDDLVSLNYLESLLSASSDDRILACSNVRTFKNNINETGSDYLTKSFEKMGLNKSNNIVSARSFLSTACAKLIPVIVLNDRRFNLKYKLGEDALFIASVSDRIETVSFTSSDVIYYRRLREGSASRKRIKFSYDAKNTFTLMFEYLKIYLKSPIKYNLLFFITRELAVFRGFLKRTKLRFI
ncbi:MAG: glycosyltransferase family 2 protein [Cellulophaga sp.]